MDDDAKQDLEASTRALEGELRVRDESQRMSEAELDRLVECGAELERALRNAQAAGTPITAEAVLAWERARQIVDQHEQAQLLDRVMQESQPTEDPGRNSR